MRYAIFVLSPLPLARMEKAVADCQRRLEELGLEGPMMEALEEHPDLEGVLGLLEEGDEDLGEALRGAQ